MSMFNRNYILVLISKYGGTDVKIDGTEMLIISESDILGIVE